VTFNSSQPFPETHWSLVRLAGTGKGEAQRRALTTLLLRYEPALLAYLRRKWRMTEEQSRDLLQEFIAHKILEYELLRHAEEGRGRFRTLLITSLNNFAVDRFRGSKHSRAEPLGEIEHMSAGKRQPQPAAIFEAAWARSLVQAVLQNMKAECDRTKRNDVWHVFESRILAELFEGRDPIPYEKLAVDLQLGSPSQAANLLVTGKRMYARLLRSAIAEYEMLDADIDAEISELCLALEVPEGE